MWPFKKKKGKPEWPKPYVDDKRAVGFGLEVSGNIVLNKGKPLVFETAKEALTYNTRLLRSSGDKVSNIKRVLPIPGRPTTLKTGH